MRLAYEPDYAQSRIGATDLRALSCRHPVTLAPIESEHWPAFLIDLLPQGAAKRRLLQRMDRDEMPEWELLEQGAWNPVGNLRVRRQDVPVMDAHAGFALEAILARGDSFIDYAADVGATVAGSTDTQGETPKFWLVSDADGRFHPDGGHLDSIAVGFWLVKFPSIDAGDQRHTILRNEASYQRVARDLGFRVTQPLPEYRDGALLLPRFDRRRGAGIVERLGVESMYALVGMLDAGAAMRHDDVLLALRRHVTDFDTELREYMGRDVLNMALGNNDNHGRNTAILKDTDGSIRLTPLFDIGPTLLDQRVIRRSTSWGSDQHGHRVDWNKVLLDLETQFDDHALDITPFIEPLTGYLRDLGTRLQALPDLMRACEVDDFIIERRAQAIAELSQDLRALGPGPRFTFGI